MVLLAMTPAIVAAIQEYEKRNTGAELDSITAAGEPPLSEPKVGNPISHGQVLELSKALREDSRSLHEASEAAEPARYHLDALLRGSRVYVKPPEAPKEPTSEYKELMSRLRRDEEARAYERMLSPPSQPFSVAAHGHTMPSTTTTTAGNISKASISQEEEDEEVTFSDINRQLALIINVLVSIIACSVTIWVAARQWQTPQRLGLSLSGAALVAVAEVVVYGGYLRRVREAKRREKRKPELKEVVETWVIGPAAGSATMPVPSAEKAGRSQGAFGDGARYRKGRSS